MHVTSARQHWLNGEENISVATCRVAKRDDCRGRLQPRRAARRYYTTVTTTTAAPVHFLSLPYSGFALRFCEHTVRVSFAG